MTRVVNLILKVSKEANCKCKGSCIIWFLCFFANLHIVHYQGNMVDWWSEEDAKEYEHRVNVMVQQASNFEVHGQNVKGELTSGENIADLGGLRLSLRAMVNSKGYDPNCRIDGFTPIQRFFLSWAQCWRQNILEERALQLLTIDP